MGTSSNLLTVPRRELPENRYGSIPSFSVAAGSLPIHSPRPSPRKDNLEKRAGKELEQNVVVEEMMGTFARNRTW